MVGIVEAVLGRRAFLVRGELLRLGGSGEGDAEESQHDEEELAEHVWRARLRARL